MTPHRRPENGFWITYVRLALLVLLVAAIPTAAYVTLALSDKVSEADQIEAFRAGCKRNVGGAKDAARISSAEIRYKRAVLAARSVQGDVKHAVTEALKVYTAVLPRQLTRVIDCDRAFPPDGEPKIVRLEWQPE